MLQRSLCILDEGMVSYMILSLCIPWPYHVLRSFTHVLCSHLKPMHLNRLETNLHAWLLVARVMYTVRITWARASQSVCLLQSDKVQAPMKLLEHSVQLAFQARGLALNTVLNIREIVIQDPHFIKDQAASDIMVWLPAYYVFLMYYY